MIKKTKKSCSTCGKYVVSLDAKKHPLLKTLLCGPCHSSYSLARDLTVYRKGSDLKGNDNYCRWCLDGGNLILCSDENCRHGFCSTCIERNFGTSFLQRLSDTNWHCFVCDYTQLDEPRRIAELFINSHKEESKKLTMQLGEPKRMAELSINSHKEESKKLTTQLDKPKRIAELSINSHNEDSKKLTTKIDEPEKNNDKMNKKKITDKMKITTKLQFNLFSSSKLCSTSAKKTVPAPPLEIQVVEPVPPKEQLEDLAKELEISDESDEEQEEQVRTKEVVAVETEEVLEWALRDSAIVKKRLKIHMDSLFRYYETYNVENFKTDPAGFSSWLKNVQAFMTNSSLIADRCQHIQKLIAPSDD